MALPNLHKFIMKKKGADEADKVAGPQGGGATPGPDLPGKGVKDKMSKFKKKVPTL